MSPATSYAQSERRRRSEAARQVMCLLRDAGLLDRYIQLHADMKGRN